jgi:hypothetical protein
VWCFGCLLQTQKEHSLECPSACVCVLLLQDLLQSCSRGGGEGVEDMCYDSERRRAEACVDESAHHALTRQNGVKSILFE